MFRRTWWTRRRTACGVLLLTAVAWVSGTEEVCVGQPLDEAKAVLWRAGARDNSNSCGMFPQLGGRKSGDRTSTYHTFINGHNFYIVADRDGESQPFRVVSFTRYTGYYKNTDGMTEQLPPAESVTLRRSVFAFVPFWGW